MISPDPTAISPHPAGARRADVLICGGGISGLSLATWLARAGVRAVVIDKNAEPGGVIGTLHKDGFIFERGPNTVMDKFDSFNELIALAGLEGEIIREPLARQQRHVWLRGALRRVPTSPLAFLASPLLPPLEKLALLREPFVRANSDDESVAEFVRRRLGAAWVRNLITPMVSGIWAGDPEQLSIAHAFPVMKEMEREGGSIVRGAVIRMRRRARERREAGLPRRVKHLVSFRDGMQRLPIALAARLGADYLPATRIEALEELAGGGFRVAARRDGQPLLLEARELVIAAESDQATGWLEPLDREVAAVLRQFPYNRLAVVALGLDAGQARLPEGFGFLVPRGEGVRLLGAIVNSNFLPGRAPAGCAALTIFIGGELDPAAVELNDDELLGSLRRDLRKTIGWQGEPRALHIERWPRAIPQYDLRHGERLRQIEAAEARRPGLHLVGNWRGGVAIGDRIETTLGLSRRILDRLGRSTGGQP